MLAALSAAAALVLACGAGAEPQERTITVTISSGAMDPQVIRVNQDDDVTLRFASDGSGELHLHGYDLTAMLTAGETAELAFVANATGRFDLELHPEEGDNGHSHDNGHTHNGTGGEGCTAQVPEGAPTPAITVAATEGEQPGEIRVAAATVDFALGAGAVPGTASGHWHLYLNGELKGMFSQPTAVVLVQEPGDYQVMASLTDPQECAYGIEATTTVTVTSAPEHAHDDGEDEPVVLGALEVHPR